MSLPILSSAASHEFSKPVKKINEGQDVLKFLVSKAYSDITAFLVQLNRGMFPRKGEQVSDLDSKIASSISKLQALLKSIDAIVDEVPLDPGTHRFGNTAFRKWFHLLEERAPDLLKTYLPPAVLNFPHTGEMKAADELQVYLLGAFGSSQRIDYGTGHELSFLAFLAGMWKLGGFQDSAHDHVERDIVLHIIEPLEPAGTHGVWGLDDHSFLPYIFGSAQYGPQIADSDATPTEGSSPGMPDPGDVVKIKVVERERSRNLYFGAIGFIYDVKKGPFWEHSPTLFDISGVRAGWAKINKGMLKMYDAEVLSKFPVVQHFPFGSLFSFERNPEAKAPTATVHTVNQPRREVSSAGAASPQSSIPMAAAPWATKSRSGANISSPTVLPARSGFPARIERRQAPTPQASSEDGPVQTKAPWSK